MLADQRTHWSGVRNYQAANNLKAMQKSERAFFYHSNQGKEIVGIVTILKTAYPDPADKTGKFVMVDVGQAEALKKPVTLAQMKNHPGLRDLRLIKQSRLSVVPIADAEWKIIYNLGGGKP